MKFWDSKFVVGHTVITSCTLHVMYIGFHVIIIVAKWLCRVRVGSLYWTYMFKIIKNMFYITCFNNATARTSAIIYLEKFSIARVIGRFLDTIIYDINYSKYNAIRLPMICMGIMFSMNYIMKRNSTITYAI